MRKTIILTYLTLISSLSAIAQNGQYLPAGIDLHEHGTNHFDGNWKLVFQDEFQYTGYPDAGKWHTLESVQDMLNTEVPSASAYKKDNAWVDGEFCILTAKAESGTMDNTDYSYTSASIETEDWNTVSGTWTYGMFEARIKMSSAHWMHQNFWLWGASEIDISEVLGYQPHTLPMNSWGYLPFKEDCKKSVKRKDNLADDFHIYTCIWDKYFTYFYIDHKLVYSLPKFQFSLNNLDYTATDYNNFITNAGYYWDKLCRYDINEGAFIILHTFLDPKDKSTDYWRKMWHKQSEGLPSAMYIDWVRAYQRHPCDESEVVANWTLLPYSHLNEKDIQLGSTDPLKPWTNIFPHWGFVDYQAESITMLPNFECYPTYGDKNPTPDKIDMGHTNFIFTARQCPEIGDSEYIDPGISNSLPDTFTNEEPVEPIDSISCNDLDTAFINIMISEAIAANDTNTLDTIHHYLDSLGCDYWPNNIENVRTTTDLASNTKHGSNLNYNQFTRQKEPLQSASISRDSKISIYPNPTDGILTITLAKTGNYTIKITNTLGITVYNGKMDNQYRKQIQLENSLPSGNYTVHITGKEVNHIEKITLTR